MKYQEKACRGGHLESKTGDGEEDTIEETKPSLDIGSGSEEGEKRSASPMIGRSEGGE